MEEDGVQRYQELTNDDSPGYTQVGVLSKRIREVAGDESPLVAFAITFESNLIMRDDVLIAMAARHGIHIPPVNYGNVRGYYSAPDGQYVVREYSRRLLDIAMRCRDQGVSRDKLLSWTAATPHVVAAVVASLGIVIPPEEIDEENEYYADRISLYLRLDAMEQDRRK